MSPVKFGASFPSPSPRHLAAVAGDASLSRLGVFMLFRTYIALPLVVVLVACGSTPTPIPAHFRGVEPLRYPSQDWITAVGESRSSLEDAETRARMAVSRKISLRLTEVYERIESELREGGRHSSTDHTISRVREESSFSRGQLIKIVDRGSYQGKHFALAVLSRAEAGEALAGGYRAQARGFRAAVEEARKNERQPARFTAAYREAMTAYRKLEPLALELAAVDPSKEAQLKEDLQLFGELQASRARVVSSLAVRIEWKGSKAAAERIRALLAREIGALGVRVGQGATSTTLMVEVKERWPKGLVLCAEWEPKVTLNDQPVPLEPPVVMGCTHGKSRSHARDDAASQLTPELFRPALEKALHSLVPLEG